MRIEATEIYNAYLAELIAYREWFDVTVERYGGLRSPMANWGNHDYNEVMRRNAQLAFGEQILGLTDEEKKAAEHAAGIKHYRYEDRLERCCEEQQ